MDVSRAQDTAGTAQHPALLGTSVLQELFPGCSAPCVPEPSVASAFVLSLTTSAGLGTGKRAKASATSAQASLQCSLCSSSMHNVVLISVFVESLLVAPSRAAVWRGG